MKDWKVGLSNVSAQALLDVEGSYEKEGRIRKQVNDGLRTICRAKKSKNPPRLMER